MYGSSIRLKTERVQRDKEALNRKNRKKSASIGQENGKLSIKTCKSIIQCQVHTNECSRINRRAAFEMF